MGLSILVVIYLNQHAEILPFQSQCVFRLYGRVYLIRHQQTLHMFHVYLYYRFK